MNAVPFATVSGVDGSIADVVVSRVGVLVRLTRYCNYISDDDRLLATTYYFEFSSMSGLDMATEILETSNESRRACAFRTTKNH